MTSRYIFHGTNKEAADIIREEGFREATFFSKHLEDAIGYGGEYVFWVLVEQARLPEGSWWQWVSPNRIPVDQIARLRHYQVTNTYKNTALIDAFEVEATRAVSEECKELSNDTIT